MMGQHPPTPEFPCTVLGETARKAWSDQASLGWINFAKGRLCKKWGEAQALYYKERPDLREKKYYTAASWSKQIVAALVDMSLAAWKNRCDCLHGHTQAEKLQLKRDKVRKRIEWCYQNKRKLPEKFHYLFKVDVEEMCNNRSPYYLQQWVESFNAVHQEAF